MQVWAHETAWAQLHLCSIFSGNDTVGLNTAIKGYLYCH